MLIAGVFILASAGQAVAVTLGGSLRSRLKIKPAQGFDAVLGAVAVVVSAAVLVWFIAGRPAWRRPRSDRQGDR